jgi:hypothetical protein
VSSARRFLSPRHSRIRARRARAVGSDERLIHLGLPGQRAQ